MGIVDLIFPKMCLGCKKLGSYVCADCIKKSKLAKQICIECQKPSIDGVTHAKCKKPWGLDGCLVVWEYGKVIRKVILKLKYNFVYEAAEDISVYMADYLEREVTAISQEPLLIPVPLHRRRSNWRGFNQSEEVGRLLSKKLGWTFSSDILVRKVSKKPQMELKGDERRENIRGVFSLNPKLNKTELSAANYQMLVFDDVLTTGATIREAAKVLKRNGAKVVWGLTVAR